MTDKDQSKKVQTLHLATKLLGRVQARNTINTKPSYESELSTLFLIDRQCTLKTAYKKHKEIFKTSEVM